MPVLESDALRVELEDARPRVLRYLHKPTGTRIDGIVEGLGDRDYLWIRHNRGIAGPLQFNLRMKATRSEAVYTLWVEEKRGRLQFDLSYAVEGDTLHLRIGNVSERGGLELHSVDLETLSMVSNRSPEWSLCTSEWKCMAFDEFHHGLRRYFDFAAMRRRHLAVAVYSNKPFLPAGIDWVQTFDAEGRFVPHHVLRFPVYCRRLGDEVQPDFHGMVGFIGDRNGDGAVDWQDVCHWVRGFHDVRVNPLYRDSWVFKITTANPPDRTHTTFRQALEMIRELHARTKGTSPAGSGPFTVYLSGWQYEGHDSKWPSVGELCARCGTAADARELVEEARTLGVTVSLHVNWDDMYADSPDFSPEIAAIGRDGEMRKGATWGGGQAYAISAYKDYHTGRARRRMKQLLDLWPLEKTLHFDVLSSNPWTESFESDRTISQMEHLVQGKWKIIDMFREEAGLDVTSEGYTRPFLEKIGYFWGLGGGYRADAARYLLHGSAVYGGCESARGRLLENVREIVFERASMGAGISLNFEFATPMDAIVDLYYLVWLPYRALLDRRIRRIWRRGTRQGTLFEDGSRTAGDRASGAYRVYDRDRLIAADYTTCLPVGEDRYLVYSMMGMDCAFSLPADWDPEALTWEPVDELESRDNVSVERSRGGLVLELPPHTGVWLKR